MLGLFENGVDADASYEECFLLIIVGEEFCEDDDVGIGNSRLFDHVAGNIELGTVAVVEPEPVKDFSHGLDIFFHVLPCVRRI